MRSIVMFIIIAIRHKKKSKKKHNTVMLCLLWNTINVYINVPYDLLLIFCYTNSFSIHILMSCTVLLVSGK